VKQRLAIAASFERFEGQSLEARRGEIAIVLPEEMSQGKAGQSVVAMLRAVFPNQLLIEKDMPIANAVLWRRRVPRVDIRRGEFRLGNELEFIAVCFEAASFCQHVENGTVEGLVRHLFGRIQASAWSLWWRAWSCTASGRRTGLLGRE
jgi:hypothetical protein